jgi:preprotein translocase subunit SecG
MEGDFLERVIAIVAIVWAASALGLAWLAFLAPVSMGRAVFFSLLLAAAAAFVASTIALGGIWTASVAALPVAVFAYFAIRRR